MTLNPTIIFYSLIIGVIIFLLLREFNCWYWKINRRIELHEETNRLLSKIVEQTEIKKTSHTPSKITDNKITDLNDPEILDKLLNNLQQKG